MTLRTKLLLPLLAIGVFTVAYLQMVTLPQALRSSEERVHAVILDELGPVSRRLAPLVRERFGGLVDRRTPPDRVRGLWLRWDRPRIAWYPGSHVSFLIEPSVREPLDEAFATLERGPGSAAA